LALSRIDPAVLASLAARGVDADARPAARSIFGPIPLADSRCHCGNREGLSGIRVRIAMPKMGGFMDSKLHGFQAARCLGRYRSIR